MSLVTLFCASKVICTGTLIYVCICVFVCVYVHACVCMCMLMCLCQCVILCVCSSEWVVYAYVYELIYRAMCEKVTKVAGSFEDDCNIMEIY